MKRVIVFVALLIWGALGRWRDRPRRTHCIGCGAPIDGGDVRQDCRSY